MTAAFRLCSTPGCSQAAGHPLPCDQGAQDPGMTQPDGSRCDGRFIALTIELGESGWWR